MDVFSSIPLGPDDPRPQDEARHVRREQEARIEPTTLAGSWYEILDLSILRAERFEAAMAKHKASGFKKQEFLLPEAEVWQAFDDPRPDAVRFVRYDGLGVNDQILELQERNHEFIEYAQNGAKGERPPLYVTREACIALELIREDREAIARPSLPGLNIAALQSVVQSFALHGADQAQALLGRLQEPTREERAESKVAERERKINMQAVVAASATIVVAASMLPHGHHAGVNHHVAPAAATQSMYLDLDAKPPAPKHDSVVVDAIMDGIEHVRDLSLDHALGEVNKLNHNALNEPNDKLGSFQAIFAAVDFMRENDILKGGLADNTDEERVELFTGNARVETGFDGRLKARNGITPDAAAGLMQVKAPEMAIKMIQLHEKLRGALSHEQNAALDGMVENYLDHHASKAVAAKIHKLLRDGPQNPKEITGILRDVYSHATPGQKHTIRDLRTDMTMIEVDGKVTPRGAFLTVIAAASLSDEAHIDKNLETKYGVAPLRYLLHQNGETRFRHMEARMLADTYNHHAWQQFGIDHDAAKNAAIWMKKEAREEHSLTHRHYRAADVASSDGVVSNVRKIIGNSGKVGVTLYRAYNDGLVLMADNGGKLQMERANKPAQPVFVAARTTSTGFQFN